MTEQQQGPGKSLTITIDAGKIGKYVLSGISLVVVVAVAGLAGLLGRETVRSWMYGPSLDALIERAVADGSRMSGQRLDSNTTVMSAFREGRSVVFMYLVRENIRVDWPTHRSNLERNACEPGSITRKIITMGGVVEYDYFQAQRDTVRVTVSRCP